MTDNEPSDTSEGEESEMLTIERTFDAPRERVWEAWTDPEQVKQWWGPNGFTTPYCEIELHTGGVFHTCMRSPDGDDYWSKGIYREIVAPERLVYTDSFSDEDGNVVDPTEYGISPGFPKEAQVTVTFDERDETTIATLEYTIGAAAATDRKNARAGWNESFDRLVEVLEG